MNVLEKILEEIEKKIEFAGRLMVENPCDKLDEIANDTSEAFILAYEECCEIIRSHMDDDKDIPHACDTCRRYGKSDHNCYYCRHKERPDLWEAKEKAHE